MSEETILLVLMLSVSTGYIVYKLKHIAIGVELLVMVKVNEMAKDHDITIAKKEEDDANV